MKLRLQFHARSLRAALRDLEGRLAASATEAAALSLKDEMQRTGAPDLFLQSTGMKRRVGSADADAIARETGSLINDPDPWLAPSLPPARVAMREAADRAVARTLALFNNKRR